MLTDDMVNRDFTRVFKGYDVDEVEDYIEALIELYNQLANENRELVLRCDRLNTSLMESNTKLQESNTKLQEAEDASAEKEGIIQDAKQQADEMLREAREKAQSIIESAETTARQLLLDVKAKVEETESTIIKKHEDAEREAKATVDAAMDEAKKLIKATKLNCVKRTEECEERLEDSRREYAQMCKKAQDFRARLYTAYSEQILAIESLEIDEFEQTQTPENVCVACDTVAEAEETSEILEEDIAELEAVEEASDESQPDEIELVEVEPVEDEPDEIESLEEATEDMTEEAADAVTEDMTEPIETAETDEAESQADYVEIVFDSDDEDISVEAEPDAEAIAKPVTAGIPKHEHDRDSSDKRFAAFNIEKEHSGQVQYNSSKIASVNKILDDIISKKGERSEQSEKSISKKLGFLK